MLEEARQGHAAPPAEAASRRARRLHAMLRGLGYDVFTGVPCSLLAAVYPVLEVEGTPYFPATREDLALGLAAGAALAGARPAGPMQKAGLGLVATPPPFA